MPIISDLGPRRLRELLKDPDKIVVCPGVYDGLGARLALSLGFEAMYMTGAGTAMSKLGYADLGIATLNDMRANAEMIAELNPSVPLIADADTGYGGPIMVARTVSQYARSGVAALHIEDQIQEKRCGQLLGKQIVEREVWYSRLRAAIIARDDAGSEMMIIARTDAREGKGFDEAVERLQGAVKLGADILFLEALQTHDEARKACRIFKDTPMLMNMVPGGVTPNMSVEQAKEIGFRIIIFPGVCIQGALKGALNSLSKLKENGLQAVDNLSSPKEAFMLCGLKESLQLDKKAGGMTFDKV